MKDLASERIKRIRRRYLDETPAISIERARYYTESWRETEVKDIPLGVRVALAMKHVYQNMRYAIDQDDRIAGTWTENYLGIPIDIERGLFNETFAVELDSLSMLGRLVSSNIRFVVFMLRKFGVRSVLHNLKRLKDTGAATPSIGLSPMHKRKINPYKISRRDKGYLQKKLLPYWKGRTIADLLRRELESSGIYSKEMLHFIHSLSGTTSHNDTIISTGSAIGTWQGHLILDHDAALKKGIKQMRHEVDEMLSDRRELKDEEAEFLASVSIALEGILIFAKRLADALEAKLAGESDQNRKEILSKMLAVCRKVPEHPAESFHEAVQSYWTVKTAVELAIPFNVHAPGRLDQIFFPYYMNDIENGLMSRDEARELLEELFLKIMSHNMRPYSNFTSYFSQRYEGSEPVTLAGQTESGEDATNELSYLMLEAADRSKAALNFVVRFHGNSPEALHMALAGLYYDQTSSVSMMNDEVCVRALEKRGFSREDALGYAVTGCVDMCAPGKTGGEAFSAILLSRVLDTSLRNGDSMTLIGLIENAGKKTGDPRDFNSFEQIIDAFSEQASHQIEKIAAASNIRDRLYAENLPSPFVSAFMHGCLENGRDVTKGGAVYDMEGILFMNSIANVVDSLFVIKKLVFEQGRFTIEELLEAVDNNYVGYEYIHHMIKELEGKWGNGNLESDSIAREITDRLFSETRRYRTYKGGFIAPFINSMTVHTYDGRISIATPDGRKAAMPFAPSCSPYNVDRHGCTGVLRSVAGLDFSEVLGCAVNIRMHPSAIGESPSTRQKWISLIKTYFNMGGSQLQPTVVSTETLRAAQRDPESHRNVIVKVGGYSAYFTDLGHEIQEEIISRSEHSSL